MRDAGLVYVHVVDHSAMGAPPVSDSVKAAIRGPLRRHLSSCPAATTSRAPRPTSKRARASWSPSAARIWRTPTRRARPRRPPDRTSPTSRRSTRRAGRIHRLSLMSGALDDEARVNHPPPQQPNVPSDRGGRSPRRSASGSRRRSRSTCTARRRRRTRRWGSRPALRLQRRRDGAEYPDRRVDQQGEARIDGGARNRGIDASAVERDARARRKTALRSRAALGAPLRDGDQVEAGAGPARESAAAHLENHTRRAGTARPRCSSSCRRGPSGRRRTRGSRESPARTLRARAPTPRSCLRSRGSRGPRGSLRPGRRRGRSRVLRRRRRGRRGRRAARGRREGGGEQERRRSLISRAAYTCPRRTRRRSRRLSVALCVISGAHEPRRSRLGVRPRDAHRRVTRLARRAVGVGRASVVAHHRRAQLAAARRRIARRARPRVEELRHDHLQSVGLTGARRGGRRHRRLAELGLARDDHPDDQHRGSERSHARLIPRHLRRAWS